MWKCRVWDVRLAARARRLVACTASKLWSRGPFVNFVPMSPHAPSGQAAVRGIKSPAGRSVSSLRNPQCPQRWRISSAPPALSLHGRTKGLMLMLKPLLCNIHIYIQSNLPLHPLCSNDLQINPSPDPSNVTQHSSERMGFRTAAQFQSFQTWSF
jgi:hypothetical protein